MGDCCSGGGETEVILRRAQMHDLDEIAAIERVSFPSPWSRSLLAAELRQADATYLVAEIAGEIAGFVGMWHVLDDAHICTLAVAPRWRGQGLGELLVLAALRRAIQVGADVVHLEYRVSNTTAARLYEKLGFARVGMRPGYYSDTGEDAVIARIAGLATPAGQRRLDEAWERWRRERSLSLAGD
ncbi:MAG: ribosomal protein S18-alanine N-acetyltransferase [Armatimonadota bacterium]